MPDVVKEVGSYAFQNCISLETLFIPQSTKVIGSCAFKGCEKLNNISFADYSITKIEAETFMDDPAIGNVTLPK